MLKVQIEFPEWVHFATDIPVRITDINYGNHLGNDALVSLLHEARMRCLAKYGYSEMDIEGVSIIMADLAIQYKNEAFYGDVLTIEISVQNFSRASFEMYYRVTSQQKLIALAKTGLICFDYAKRKIVSVPQRFVEKFSDTQRIS